MDDHLLQTPLVKVHAQAADMEGLPLDERLLPALAKVHVQVAREGQDTTRVPQCSSITVTMEQQAMLK